MRYLELQLLCECVCPRDVRLPAGDACSARELVVCVLVCAGARDALPAECRVRTVLLYADGDVCTVRTSGIRRGNRGRALRVRLYTVPRSSELRTDVVQAPARGLGGPGCCNFGFSTTRAP
eukprot:1328307-Prymnesium_polylepis.1